MTIAGILDVALGGIGLFAATLMALAIGALAWFIAVIQWAAFLFEGEFVVAPGLAGALGAILAYGLLASVSVFADACLLVTGFRLLARSRNARRSAFLFASAILPLGAIDVVIVQHAGYARELGLALVLALPVYSVAQVVAFFVLPSWRELTTGSSTRSTS